MLKFCIVRLVIQLPYYNTNLCQLCSLLSWSTPVNVASFIGLNALYFWEKRCRLKEEKLCQILMKLLVRI